MDTSSQSDLPAISGYEINRLIGYGGMGIVYKALRRNDNRWVALKMINSRRPDLKERFRREVHAVARLRHPNIVELYDTGSHDGWPYFTMEFVGGGNLAENRQRYVSDFRLAASLVEHLARAVQHAHEQGIVHRDLKPGNILIAENGDPKITDFGLAKCLDGADESLTSTAAIMGTPAYMAPEVARGEMRTAGPAVDIYALGVMLYELLTGRVPFRGKSQLEVLDLIRTLQPQWPNSVRRSIPLPLAVVCMRCLEKEPRDRPASALELAEQLAGTHLWEAGKVGVQPAQPVGTPPEGRAGSETAQPPTDDHVMARDWRAPSGEAALPDVDGFEVLEEAGRGGLSVVYRARQLRLRRVVALRLPAYHYRTREALERFRIEGELLSRLQHPNVVQLFDVGDHEGAPYLVEEFLEGGTLADRLRPGPMAERDAVALTVTLARAMHYVHHALGDVVVHRNLKPGVVMFTAAGIPKVVNFGVVHAPSLGTGLLDVPGAVMGTQSYLPPEQAMGNLQDLGPGTDVYGLGGILYEMLTGRPPFGVGRGEGFADLLRRVIEDPPTRPRQCNAGVSRGVEKACLKALEKDPLRRHASAQELAEELERCGKGWFG